MKTFHSNGKLLLSGEYVVLDGATALAVPTIYGQVLKIEERTDNSIFWKSYQSNNKIWAEAHLLIDTSGSLLVSGQPTPIAERLHSILQEAHLLNPEILKLNNGYNIVTNLEFPVDWGLGSSSTLINNIAQWFKIDPFELLKKTFGGSGYDIAAAQHDHPILYSLEAGTPKTLRADFEPGFKEELFFVYLNQKQNSRNSIQHYRGQSQDQLQDIVQKISALSLQILLCKSIEEFELLLEIHETLISKIIDTPKVKTKLFPDFPRSIKSLGGWGGDFVLATGGEAEREYFRAKGYTTILKYSEMVLES